MTKIYSVFTCLHTKKDLSSLIAFEEKLENYLLYDVLCGVFKIFCIGFQWHEYFKLLLEKELSFQDCLLWRGRGALVVFVAKLFISIGAKRKILA